MNDRRRRLIANSLWPREEVRQIAAADKQIVVPLRALHGSDEREIKIAMGEQE
jgi:hypothetical protein